MWVWLGTLPLAWQIVLPIILMVVIVTISIWGNAAIKWGKKSIGFGRRKENSCSRCRNLVMTISIKYKTDRDVLHESILRDQMNYSDQKLHTIDLELSRSYRQMIIDSRSKNAVVDVIREQKEYLLYVETLSNSFHIVSKELLRSFKENGFNHMSPIEYTQYCKEKTAVILSIMNDYLMSNYPFEGMIVSLQKRFDSMDINRFETYIFNIFDRSKEIHADTNAKIKVLDDKFESKMDAVEL